ncbi:hypothetical protein HY498_04590 [Candidatus Woesearchaeota archaeon]|nr:hypothetical protein [Candidatus Woesearchaeota archaeon]
MKQSKDEVNKADLTHREDLSIVIMNLISLEEHFAFTTMKTKKQEYLEILAAVRKFRVKLMKQIIRNTEGEIWCISKHLLAATMRLMETATKFIGRDNEAAYEFEKGAFELYGLFWLLQKLDNEEENKPKMEEVKT